MATFMTSACCPATVRSSIWAPVLLVVASARAGSHGVGAQWGGAALLLTEHAPVERHWLLRQPWSRPGAIVGAVAGNLFFLVLLHAHRRTVRRVGLAYPFLSGLVLVAIGACTAEDRGRGVPADAATVRRIEARAGLRRHRWSSRPPARSGILQAAGAFFVVNATFTHP
ncbi:hypothetical protein HBB16_15985 [Pseudonocardia sp. MCCB 268]|nr:hypothetical protein [Pseudonocardia cytotoxica]